MPASPTIDPAALEEMACFAWDLDGGPRLAVTFDRGRYTVWLNEAPTGAVLTTDEWADMREAINAAHDAVDHGETAPRVVHEATLQTTGQSLAIAHGGSHLALWINREATGARIPHPVYTAMREGMDAALRTCGDCTSPDPYQCRCQADCGCHPVQPRTLPSP